MTAGDVSFSVSFELRRTIDKTKMIDPGLDFREPATVASFFRELSNLAYERAVFAFLDDYGRCLGTVAYRGNETECCVVTREIVSAALLSGATSVVMVHNHVTNFTDGNICFSEPDIKIFNKLHWQLSIFRIDLIDSIIISGQAFSSYKQQQAEAERLKKLDAYGRGDLAVIQNDIPPEKDGILFIDDDPKIIKQEFDNEIIQ
ncbi:MAG TPA: JAB domain-containing protein [Smithellaceae bacterium]|nr:JAB domain-containing protein [Smithellaceae bacterium]